MALWGIPDALWNTLAGAFFGGLISTGIVAFLTQRWIEGRERRNRRDELRLELYLDIVDVIDENAQQLSERDVKGCIPPKELQLKRFNILRRLKLLGSLRVQSAYDRYDKLVYQSTVQEARFWPKNPEGVSQSCDTLVHLMAEDVGPQS